MSAPIIAGWVDAAELKMVAEAVRDDRSSGGYHLPIYRTVTARRGPMVKIEVRIMRGSR